MRARPGRHGKSPSDVTGPGEGWSTRWRRAGAVCAAAVGVVFACGPSAPIAPAATRAPATAAPDPTPAIAPLSEWQTRGATEVPPPQLQTVSLDGIEVVNQTGRALSDAEAAAWARSFLRAMNFEYWAVSRQQDQFLIRSGLSPSPLAVFRPDLSDIATARRSKSQIDYTPKVFRRMVLRTVPATMQAAFNTQLVTWKPYAFYLDAVGPSSKRVTDAAGRQTTQTLYQPGEPAFELVGGELVHDPLMGDVFAFASDFDCVDPSNRQALAPLCNP